MKEKSGFSRRLSELLQERGARLRLAKESGLASSSITRYAAGQMPRADELLRIARALGVSTDYLLTGRDPPAACSLEDLPRPELHFARAADQAPEVSAHLRRDEYLAVPLVEGSVAAGAARVVADQIEGWAMIHASAIGRRRNLVAVRVAGDSMAPLLTDGTIVAIDRDDRRIRPGAIYAVRVDGGITVKYVELEGQELVLIPENRAHREQRVHVGEGADSPVLGRMVWSWRSWVGDEDDAGGIAEKRVRYKRRG
jgi:phage repressor protein C with HTH and peptisase S24 domain